MFRTCFNTPFAAPWSEYWNGLKEFGKGALDMCACDLRHCLNITDRHVKSLGFHLLKVVESDFYIELGLVNGKILWQMSKVKQHNVFTLFVSLLNQSKSLLLNNNNFVLVLFSLF